MTDLHIDELYGDVIASVSPIGFIRQTLRDLVRKLKTDDVFVPHDVSLTVLRSERTALLYVEQDEGWAALLMRVWPGDRHGKLAFHRPEASVCHIGRYRTVFSIPADIDDVAVKLERDGWSIVPMVPGWTNRANIVPTDNDRYFGEVFEHAVTRCPLSSERKQEIKRRQQERGTEQRGQF